MTRSATNYQRVGVCQVWTVLQLLVVMELSCIGLWVATGAAPPLLAALMTGFAIIYLAIF
jgi:hypothetical protein